MTIVVVTSYAPREGHFETVMSILKTMIADKDNERSNCISTEVGVAPERGEILTISHWHSREAFELYLDNCVDTRKVIEVQAQHMRREIDTRMFNSTDIPNSVSSPRDMVANKDRE